jgi:hypothetical protein
LYRRREQKEKGRTEFVKASLKSATLAFPSRRRDAQADSNKIDRIKVVMSFQF